VRHAVRTPYYSKFKMKGFIKLSVLEIDGDDIQFEIEVQSNCCKTTLDFYGHADLFEGFGRNLMQFPKNIADKVSFQLGEDESSWAYYLMIEAFCFDSSGHSALKILVDNKGEMISSHRSEFALRSEAASINSFGKMLLDWKPLEVKEVIWESIVFLIRSEFISTNAQHQLCKSRVEEHSFGTLSLLNQQQVNEAPLAAILPLHQN
jgi:hypothetical protein